MEKQLHTYRALNALANPGGLVVFGGEADRHIPLCELKQAFDLDFDLYNRSIAGLSVDNAIGLYDDFVAPLKPQDVYLHIGGADRELFAQDAAAFDQKLSRLLRHIKASDSRCRVALISLKDEQQQPEMNKHLEAVAKSEQWEFCDISGHRLWNPKQTKDVLSFIYSTGFLRPLNRKRPLYDLVKLLFCCE